MSEPAEILGYAIIDQAQIGGIDKFVDRILMDIADTQISEGWTLKKPEMLNDLAHFAYFEVVAPRGCSKCHGKGSRMQGDSLETCKTCLGTGSGSYPSILIADSCGIHERDFHRTWKRRYALLYNEAMKYKNELYGHILRHT